MSTEYIHRIRFVKQGNIIELQAVAESNNVRPLMTSADIARDCNFERFGSVIPVTATPEEFRDWLEGKSAGFDGGCYRRRREWINGEEAFGWLSRRLKSDIGIAAPAFRKHEVVWGTVARNILQRCNSQVIPALKKGDAIAFEHARAIAGSGIELYVDVIRWGRCAASRCRIGSIQQGALFVKAPGKRSLGYLIAEDGEFSLIAAQGFPGMNVQDRATIPTEVFSPTSASEIGKSPLFVLLLGEDRYLARSIGGSVSCERFFGADGRTRVLRYEPPAYFTELNAQAALERLNNEYPEAPWTMLPCSAFSERLVEGWLLAA
jgi:hypothetical protein